MGKLKENNNFKSEIEKLQSSHDLIEQRLEQQNREMATLLSIQKAITSRLDRQEVLQMIADGARRLVNSLHAGVYFREGDHLRLVVLSLDPSVVKFINLSVGYIIPLKHSIGRQVIETGKSILIPDVRNDPRVNPDVLQRTPINSYLAVPLKVGRKVFGILFASDKKIGTLTTNDERILSLLASSAVIGLENARLYKQAEENAALAERNRLARELHDAVTQTLFSASLISEVLPQIWEIDRDEGLRRLEELRQLTRGALTEMRTMLLELRPQALMETGTKELFEQLVKAFSERTRIHVQFQHQGEYSLPGEIKVSLYRITQEALNNITNHAEAKNVVLNLNCQRDFVSLEIGDDGIGFELSEVPIEHLGLRIMQERAEAIGADIVFESKFGHGTKVNVNWNPKKDG